MSADRRVPARPRAGSRNPGIPRGDGGFTLIEVMVSMVVIGTVMAALTVFFTNSLTLTSQKRSEQMAVQLAGDAVERARAIKGSALLAGRSETKSTEQWDAVVEADKIKRSALRAGQSEIEIKSTEQPDVALAAVKPYLDTMKRASDPVLTTGDAAPLPTRPVAVTVGGVEYEQHWYVGHCRQQGVSATGQTRACEDPGLPDPEPGNVDVLFFRVVVAVTWDHRSCWGGRCAYVTSTLVSPATDPVFYIKRPAPKIADPGAQYGYRTVAMNLQLLASGGRLPLKWSFTGLPAGLDGSDSGLISGTPTGTGPFTVKATVTDRHGDTDNAEFPLTVFDLPELTGPGDQATRAGTAVRLENPATGGRGPLTWSATGLPTGLSIDAKTGVISGTPTAYETKDVTVKITDQGGKTDSVTFEWKVLTLKLTGAARTNSIRDDVETALTATGGAKPYTWRAENLPDGLEIDPGTGLISGTTTWGTRYLTTVYVKDGTGDEVSTTFLWTVQHRHNNDIRVTGPDPAAPDQTGAAGRAVTLAATATGGSNSGYNTWTADGLPPGLSIARDGNFNAKISGTPTTPGTYTVTLKVVDSQKKWATLMFTWVVR
ncbi:putative Ig domain-containing protein [Planomonospora venezuelensis]|uniref:Prepilin-type N-terminal cleavage/methylation domain-containing protein n=1 Tax=Planomonospora venezuelensis TaxID=1999 RepID=A0A841DB54_PLAVE|nr:putative Ig domain-containing protein [Planomonospora venezuelensis]MBB5966719.1 prepilin-type N-terminal cleavage/methylation domain-containing protein [Planomonospora venezuelensis]GIN00310.1 hypothetical protein Pve01_19680 [Planomonospora venezuelensis]